ncbi:unnamed protein product [Amoebophrya sp. A120]|nr:unnamed protein product [Amoebophrya sp. A120]|eukprot:GSA120T00011368001.1
MLSCFNFVRFLFWFFPVSLTFLELLGTTTHQTCPTALILASATPPSLRVGTTFGREHPLPYLRRATTFSFGEEHLARVSAALERPAPQCEPAGCSIASLLPVRQVVAEKEIELTHMPRVDIRFHLVSGEELYRTVVLAKALVGPLRKQTQDKFVAHRGWSGRPLFVHLATADGRTLRSADTIAACLVNKENKEQARATKSATTVEDVEEEAQSIGDEKSGTAGEEVIVPQMQIQPRFLQNRGAVEQSGSGTTVPHTTTPRTLSDTSFDREVVSKSAFLTDRNHKTPSVDTCYITVVPVDALEHFGSLQEQQNNLERRSRAAPPEIELPEEDDYMQDYWNGRIPQFYDCWVPYDLSPFFPGMDISPPAGYMSAYYCSPWVHT